MRTAHRAERGAPESERRTADGVTTKLSDAPLRQARDVAATVLARMGAESSTPVPTGEDSSAADGADASVNSVLHSQTVSAIALLVSAFVEVCRKVAEIVILEGASRVEDVSIEEVEQVVLARAPALRSVTLKLSAYLVRAFCFLPSAPVCFLLYLLFLPFAFSWLLSSFLLAAGCVLLWHCVVRILCPRPRGGLRTGVHWTRTPSQLPAGKETCGCIGQPNHPFR